ncbi:hypothetical protein SKAU_G00030080 [Synaphobranchus kaupii]|uniref:Uncharacterized protein n=1 Tax=Synaphobranchus kaupii TaxID=118154 RepID=A0A9Q1JEZ1_SYNKA|nr:hypothetical protein SKAU_G00030080 [Synaphobranchus kaupii]
MRAPGSPSALRPALSPNSAPSLQRLSSSSFMPSLCRDCPNRSFSLQPLPAKSHPLRREQQSPKLPRSTLKPYLELLVPLLCLISGCPSAWLLPRPVSLSLRPLPPL